MNGNSEEPNILFRFGELSTSGLTFQSEEHTVYICQFECNESHTLSHGHYHITQAIAMGHITINLHDQQFQTTGILFPVLSIMMNTLKLFVPYIFSFLTLL